MDRQITSKERRRRNIIRAAKAGGVLAVLLVGAVLAMRALQSRIRVDELTIATVDSGTISVSVGASGRVAPAIEETVNSPISTRLIEVYRRPGDTVQVGEPLLRLDLTSTQDELDKLLDQERMKRLQIEQAEANDALALQDLEMRIEVATMRLARQEAELREEHFLDSLGASTADKLRQAELSYETARLELRQMRQQLANERRAKAVDMQVKRLDLNVFVKTVAAARRTMQSAQLMAPRAGVLTFITTEVGAQVSAGSRVAVVSDLSRFAVKAQISESYADRVTVGSPATIKVGRTTLSGTVTQLNPRSDGGFIDFLVMPDSASHRNLRPGISADVYVLTSVRDDVLRLPAGRYYVGPGTYKLYVLHDDELLLREVRLGDSSYDYVEVLDGLHIGDRVVLSDLTSHGGAERLKLKME